MVKPEDLARPEVRALKGYDEEAAPGALNLSNNTNLFGTNPALGRALAKARADSFWDYPSLSSQPLREAVAQKLGVAPEQIVTGNGSNELIDGLNRAFTNPGDRVVYHPPTFSMIPVFAGLNSGKPIAVPLKEGFQLDPEALIEANGKLTFVVRPNNPTGNAFPRKEVMRVIEDASGLVIVDEAYIEFYEGSSFVSELAANPHVVLLRTMSKAYGLAGLRIGYAVASPGVAAQLAKARGPFKLNSFSEFTACIALADKQFVEHSVKECRQERPRLARMLEERGFTVFPSDANFLLTKPPHDARAMADALAARGVWVRDFSGDLAPYLRITVGPASITQKLASALDGALKDLEGKGVRHR